LKAADEDSTQTDKRVTNINSGDLSEEKNVERIFSKIEVPENAEIYLYSTVGGYFGGKEVTETEVEDFDRMVNINLKANFLIARQFLKIFGGRNTGGMCFTSAESGFKPEKSKFAYGASKSALNYLISTLALECEEKEIAVNGIAPYILDTPENRKWAEGSDFDKWHKTEEAGELADFIFSARKYISGNIISLKIRFRR
jgi:NAD(P)-dependent dehydrogenase (short-subunit alcohol dehydrogenase family)